MVDARTVADAHVVDEKNYDSDLNASLGTAKICSNSPDLLDYDSMRCKTMIDKSQSTPSGDEKYHLNTEQRETPRDAAAVRIQAWIRMLFAMRNYKENKDCKELEFNGDDQEILEVGLDWSIEEVVDANGQEPLSSEWDDVASRSVQNTASCREVANLSAVQEELLHEIDQTGLMRKMSI